MIISTSTDHRAAAQRKLPPFLFHYIDDGAYTEYTLRRNVENLSAAVPRQRVLKNMSELSLEVRLLDKILVMPVALVLVGLTGIYARRGETQVTRAAATRDAPFTLSTVSVCLTEETAPAIDRPMQFQLYALKDRGFMRNALERVEAVGVTTLMFTVDMSVPDARYRDTHPSVSDPYATPRRILQAMTHLVWVWGVDLLGKPHDLDDISTYHGNPTGLEDYISWLDANFDPSISWKDLEWIHEFWDGPMVVKGTLDPEDTRDAVKLGADGIVVSNRSSRQLDGVLFSARALPAVADVVKGELVILADSSIRIGLDVVRMITPDADSVLLGHAFVYTLTAVGEARVRNLPELIEKEIRAVIVLARAKLIGEINVDSLVRELGA